MVKLFVGNLSPTVENQHLRDIFSKYGKVDECDIIKNYAFVHMTDDDEATEACKCLDNHVLEGRPIHIEKSTSRLRKAPGMASVCFRCGSNEHKTPSCPQDQDQQRKKSPISNGRSRGPYPLVPPRRNDGYQMYMGGGYPGPQAPMGPGPDRYYPPPTDPYRPQQDYSGMTGPPPPAAYAAPVPVATTDRRSTRDMDPVLPRPTERDLEALYGQYLDSRERYYYFREKLEKEMMARARDPFASYAAAPPADPYAAVQAAAQSQAAVVRYPEVYYSQTQPATYNAYAGSSGVAGYGSYATQQTYSYSAPPPTRGPPPPLY